MTIKNEWEVDQLVKSGVYSNPDAVIRSALSALFAMHPEQKMQMIVVAYRGGDISLGKAAELLGVSSEEIKDIFRQAGVPIHLGPETAEELQREISNLESP